MSKWELREEVLRALPLIFGLHGHPNPPQNLVELVKILYPQYEDCANVSRTKEYISLRPLLERKKVEKWLAAIFGTFPESELAQCSFEEEELGRAILKEYPNGYNALRKKLSSFLMGFRQGVQIGETDD